MVLGMWGRKIGMTQVFSENKVVPVTVIDTTDWIVTAVRTKAKDGYDAMQIGCLRKRYAVRPFLTEWLKKPAQYFQYVREVKCDQAVDHAIIGQPVDGHSNFLLGQKVDVMGFSIGRGFAGVYKRHGFGGAAKSHGSMMGRSPGSIGGLRTSGRVIKGKRMAGHMGVERVMIKQLKVVDVDAQHGALLVKGAVPGKAGSLVFVRKA